MKKLYHRWLLSLRSDNYSDELGFFRENYICFRKVPTSRVFHKKSSFFTCQGLVEICSKMMSFVDIFILGHPIPYLLRVTFLILDHILIFYAKLLKLGRLNQKKDKNITRTWNKLDLACSSSRLDSHVQLNSISQSNSPDRKFVIGRATSPWSGPPAHPRCDPASYGQS